MGVGNAIFNYNKLISSIEDIRAIETMIKNEQSEIKNVVILHFSLLEEMGDKE